MSKCLALFLSTMSLLTMEAEAESLKQVNDRVEVNWSSLRVRFYGESKVEQSSGENGYKTAEKDAWRDGLSYVSKSVVPYLKKTNSDIISQYEDLVSDRLSRATYSFNTTYAATGDIRVHLESKLLNALAKPEFNFSSDLAPDVSKYASTGVVLRLSRAVEPRATYELLDEDKNILFSLKNMSKEGYEQSLMGRWFVKPSSGEISRYVGKEPIEIKVEVDGNGRFIVSRSTWASGSSTLVDLLASGRTVVALPKQ